MSSIKEEKLPRGLGHELVQNRLKLLFTAFSNAERSSANVQTPNYQQNTYQETTKVNSYVNVGGVGTHAAVSEGNANVQSKVEASSYQPYIAEAQTSAAYIDRAKVTEGNNVTDGVLDIDGIRNELAEIHSQHEQEEAK